jgi:putative ABC transport system permease protein
MAAALLCVLCTLHKEKPVLRNYLKIALRNLIQHKGYSIINIGGLAVGMACFIFVALYIRYELSYDKFHQDSDLIYRIVVKQAQTYEGTDMSAVTPAPLAEVLKSNYPEISYVTRLRIEGPALIQSGENAYMEDKFFYIDPDFLEMFSFPLVSGNYKTALNEPYSLILTEEMAHKYFGAENPVGKTIIVHQKHQQQPYIVTGIIKSAPSNSHLHFNFLASFSTLYKQQYSKNQEHSLHWNARSFYTYIKLKKNASPKAMETKFVDLIKEYKGKNSNIQFLLEPIERIHLYQGWNTDIETNGDIRYVYLFAAIGFFILLIACFNYVNISTSQSIKRAKEVGLRKVVGANRGQLLKQFLSESLVFACLGFCLAIFIVELAFPSLQSFMDKDMQFSIFADTKMLFGLLAILLIVGCIAGAYPAFVISSFQPTQILKGATKGKSESMINLRNSLVIFQFVISAVLIVSTITVYNQLHFMRNKKLGIGKDHIVTLQVFDEDLQKNHASFLNELCSNPHILDIFASQSLPPGTSGSANIDWDGRKDSDLSLMYGIRADHRFAYLYEIPVIDGRNYSENLSSSKSYFLLNRSAVKALGWKNAIGKRFEWNDTRREDGQVIGVVDDFHFFPLDREIEPLAIELVGSHLKNWRARYFSIKISSENIPGTLSFIEEKWKQYSHYPLQLQFFDKRMDKLYRAEQKLGQLFNLFAFVAIFISCLGLYGLTSSSIEQRTKEIGIRKVLGSTISQIINLLTKETVICILIANLFAWPIAWYAMNKWLQNFAYRIEMRWWIFALAGGLALVIALLTVS